MKDIFKDDDIVFSYTRKQAIEDGVLFDVTEQAKELGFKFPVAITSAVQADLMDIPNVVKYQTYRGRLFDVLFMLLVNIKAASNKGKSLINFSLFMPIGEGYDFKMEVNYHLKSLCGPGDEGEAVITIMLPEED